MPRKKKSVSRAKRSVKRAKGPIAKSTEFAKERLTKGAEAVKNISKIKVRIVLKNLMVFGILFVLSVIVAMASSNEVIDQLFWIVAILTAFVGVALIIVLLTLLFMRAMKKQNK